MTIKNILLFGAFAYIGIHALWLATASVAMSNGTFTGNDDLSQFVRSEVQFLTK